jgi:hypothetical protein
MKTQMAIQATTRRKPCRAFLALANRMGTAMVMIKIESRRKLAMPAPEAPEHSATRRPRATAVHSPLGPRSGA